MARKKWFSYGFSAVVAIAVIQACGSGGNAGSGGASNSLSTSPVSRKSFYNRCPKQGAFISLNGISVCRSVIRVHQGIPTDPFPKLSIADTKESDTNGPGGNAPFRTKINVLKGDAVKLQAYGNQGILSGLGRVFAQAGCDGPDVTGTDSSGEAVYGADGQPAGLYGELVESGESRSSAFLIGKNYDLGVVTDDAVLYVGWNQPTSATQKGAVTCEDENSRLSAMIIRCVDEAGNSYQCPF